MKTIKLENGIEVKMDRKSSGSYRILLKRGDIELTTSTNNSPVWDYMSESDVEDEESELKHREAVEYLKELAEQEFDQYDFENHNY